MELKWTIRTPHKPGYYWVRQFRGTARLVTVAHLLNHNGESRVRVFHLPHPNDEGLAYEGVHAPCDPVGSLSHTTHEWYGPIVTPSDDRHEDE